MVVAIWKIRIFRWKLALCNSVIFLPISVEVIYQTGIWTRITNFSSKPHQAHIHFHANTLWNAINLTFLSAMGRLGSSALGVDQSRRKTLNSKLYVSLAYYIVCSHEQNHRLRYDSVILTVIDLDCVNVLLLLSLCK